MWGASHLFLRVAIPVFGPEKVAFLRLMIGSLVMSVPVLLSRRDFRLRENFRLYILVGLLNGAIPFLMFARAALKLPASYLSVLNSTTPLFSALITWVWLQEPMTRRRAIGLLLGLSGVVLMEQFGPVAFNDWSVFLSLGEGLLAAFCYAAVGLIIKRKAGGIAPGTLTAGSFAFASLALLPLAITGEFPRNAGALGEQNQWLAVGGVLFLGVFSSGIAFLMYYRLINRIGAFRSSLTTFLVPVFGILWGRLFLGETVDFPMLAGVAMILSAIGLLILV
jgi:drug/metabolite transporter (DMT)-like permease